MNCPQCHESYSHVQPAMIIPDCGDSYCLKCLKAMQKTFGGVWCLNHPPSRVHCKQDEHSRDGIGNDCESMLLDSYTVSRLKGSEPPLPHLSNISQIVKGSQSRASHNTHESIGLINSNVYKIIPFYILNLSQLPINHTLMALTNAYCQNHKELKNLYCIDDGCNVCEKCAIFGEHKDHQMLPNQLVEKTADKIKSELKKNNYYLYGNPDIQGLEDNTKSQSVRRFLQGLKSENVTRKEQIAKWLSKNVTKISHRIQKDYQQLIWKLRQQKQQCLKQFLGKLEQIASILSAIPRQEIDRVEKLEKDMGLLKAKQNHQEYLWFQKANSILERLISTKKTVKEDLKAKLLKFDSVVSSLEIDHYCYFKGNLPFFSSEKDNKQYDNESERHNTTQNSVPLYKILTGSQIQQDSLLLETPKHTSIKSQNFTTISLTKEGGQYYQPGKHKLLKKQNERRVKQSARMFTLHNTQHCSNLLKVQSQQAQFKEKSKFIRSSSSRKSLIQKNKTENSSYLRTNSSILSVKSELSDSKEKSRNKNTSLDESLVFSNYPESRTFKVPSSTKIITANGIYLDNFKAIQIIRKSLASGANLKKIDFSNNKLTNKFLQFMVEMTTIRSLKQVNLANNRLEPHLASRQLSKLMKMEISIKLQ